MKLEQYSTDSLSLLPKGFRLQLLHMIPIIDICRLENTKFISGIDMQAIWMELHREYLRASLYDSSLDWRESFFRRFFFAIVRGERPYGHYYVGRLKNQTTPTFGRQRNEGRPVSEHEVDFVNFLVAVKREIPVTVKFSKMNIVTLFKGPVSRGKAYNGLCRAKQFVPPRYTKFFSEGSYYLPDSTALNLITEKCHYRPKEFTVDIVSSTLAFNLTPKKTSVNCLRNCFKNIESLNIQGYIAQSQRATVICGAKYGECKDVARCALDSILSAPNPKFTSLTIRFSPTENVIDTITPALAAYGGLKELTLQAYGDVSPDFQKLSLITEHQPLLHTVSVLVGIGMVRRPQSNIVSCAPKLSEKHFISWLQTCFKKPLLRDLKLSLEPAYLMFLIQVLTDFLSTPCSHEQTLTIRCDLKDFSPKLPPRPPRIVKSEPPLPSNPNPSPPNDPTSPPLSPEVIFSSEPIDVLNTPIHQFDDACTMKYKCLTFDSCKIGPLFAKAFLELAPLKLKSMSILKRSAVHFYSTEFLSQLAQHPLIEMETLELELDTKDMSNFDSILQKKLLKFVTVTCSDSCFNKFSDISLRRGFEIKTIVKTPKGSVVFTLSRN